MEDAAAPAPPPNTTRARCRRRLLQLPAAVAERAASLLLAASASASASPEAEAAAEAALSRTLYREVVLPRVREALLSRRPGDRSAATTTTTAQGLLQHDPQGLGRVLAAARAEVVAAAVVGGQNAVSAASLEQQEDDADADDDNETWLGGGEGEGEQEQEQQAGAAAAASQANKGGGGVMSLFALYDVPAVVLVDMGEVAARVGAAKAAGDVDGVLAGLGQLEGVRT